MPDNRVCNTHVVKVPHEITSFYNLANTLTEHIKMVHHEIKAHLCQICEIAFKSKDVLEITSSQMGGKICEECGRDFTNQSDLTCHIKKGHKKRKM